MSAKRPAGKGIKSACVNVIRQQAGDKITTKQADELIKEIMARLEGKRLLRLGESDETLAIEIAREVVEEHKMAKAIQTRNAILTIKARRRVMDFVKNPKWKTYGEGLLALINGTRKVIKGGRLSIDAQTVAIRNKYAGKLLAVLEKHDAVRDFRDLDMDKDLHHELYYMTPEKTEPSTGNKHAFEIAKELYSMQRELVARENRAGAYIRQNDHYAIRQTHDMELIRKAGGDNTSESSYKVWKEFVLPLLDPKTFVGRDDTVESFLRKVHQGIITGVHGKMYYGHVNADFSLAGSLAKKISQERIIHFKDAESAYAYNQRFGSKSFRDGFLSDIRRAAHNVVLLENLGPNPEVTFQRIVHTLKEEARSLPNDKDQIDSLNSEWLNSSFKSITGQLDIPASAALYNVTKGLQSWATLSRLGGVLLSAIPDKAFFHAAMTYNGIKGFDALKENFGLFVPKTKEDRMRLHMLGAGIDGFLGTVASRFASHDNYAGSLTKLQQLMFRMNGINWWNDIHKESAAKMLSNWYGSHTETNFFELPGEISKVLSMYDIGPVEWGMTRNATYKAEDGRVYLDLEKIRDMEVTQEHLDLYRLSRSPNNEKRVLESFENKLRTLITDQVDDAIITPGNRERVAQAMGTQSGTVSGTVVRLLMHFKSFPITVWNKVVQREMYGHGSGSFKEWIMSDRKGNFRLLQVIAMTTIGGYISMTIKDLLKGRTPRRIVEDNGDVNMDVITTSMLRGGGLGIYGDLLFSEYDRSYKNALNTLAGPILGQIPEAAAIATDARNGKNVGASLQKFAANNTPFANLFYIKPVLDYTILWQLQEMLDPGSLRRMEKSIQRNNHQEFFFRPSENVR